MTQLLRRLHYLIRRRRFDADLAEEMDLHFMKDSARTGSGGRGTRRWTTVFLTAECGLTMVMLAALVLGVRSSRAAGRTYVAIDSSNVVTTWMTLSADRYRTPDRRAEFYRQLDERLASLPGVSSAAIATALPLGGASARQLGIDGRTPVAGRTPPTV